ncbi:MAG: DUF3325 domain-containing protein [Emcibacter sp.]|nr:DUF3325 domain-containing protein [Emcibacter sp.]
MILLSFILTLIGCTVLCLAMARHHRQIWNRAPDRRTAFFLRFVGGGLMTSAVVICMESTGWVFGLVTWLGIFTASTILLVFLLPYAAVRVVVKSL